MSLPMKLLVLSSLLALPCLLIAENESNATPRKKLIEYGWDAPDTQWFRQNLKQMESSPFNGITLQITGQSPDGKPRPTIQTFVEEKWEPSWFASCIEDLKSARSTRLTDNFIYLSANPGVDWFDDEGWANVVDHWRILARVAREGGCKGFVFDPEDYSGGKYGQFMYRKSSRQQEADNAFAESDRHTFAEVYAKARERGQQVMRAVAAEFPDIIILCLYLNGFNAGVAGQPDPLAGLEKTPFGLLPAFLDGWLDEMPPSVSIVDGCESGYLYNSTGEYLESYLATKGVCQWLVSPKNRAKYRAQVQAAFPIYLNAYTNPKESSFYIDPKGSAAVSRLRTNVNEALRVADEYVWVYCEKYQWWPFSGREPMFEAMEAKPWSEVFPGSDEAFRFASAKANRPNTFALELIQSGKLQNLAVNGNFLNQDAERSSWKGAADWGSSVLKGWSTWQHQDSKGVFSWDRERGASEKGSARLAGIKEGCMIQHLPVEPGETYAIQAKRILQGKGDAVIRIRWKDRDGKWAAENEDRFISADGPRDEWAGFSQTVKVPAGASSMVILFSAHQQESTKDVAWFDDAGIYKID